MTQCNGPRLPPQPLGSRRRPAAFFDRDGIINLDSGYLHRPDDFVLMPGVVEAIRACNQAGFWVFVVTNQGGIGLGLYDEAAVDRLHEHMRAELAQYGAYIDDIRYCGHHPDAVNAHYRAVCDWRKPGAGMILDLMRVWPVDAAASFLIGDRQRDVAAARAAGIAGHLYEGGDFARLVRVLITASNARRIRRWLVQDALPYWSSAGRDSRGGFAERLTPDGSVDTQVAKRILVQMRQVYVYAHAAVLGLSPHGATLARDCFDYVIAKARLPDGGFAYALSPDGSVADPTRDAYTHAFLLMGASWLYRATGDEAVRARITEIAVAIETLRHPGGLGYSESDRPGPVRRQNPHMHLFEAFLAAHEATADPIYLARAKEIYTIFVDFFYDTPRGVLREYFEQDFSPAEGPQGEIVEGGHHYEWVWLLGEYAKASGGPLSPVARVLHTFAASHTHEPETGLIYHENCLDGSVRQGGKRAWPLTEAIKASIALAEADGGMPDLRADHSVDLLFQHFLDRPRPGAWLDTVTPQNTPAVTTSTASNFYHVFLAFAEYIRFAAKV